jgi:hypothetical protein
MKKTIMITFLFTSFTACDAGDSLLSYEPEAGATYLALSDGLPPESHIPDKELDLDDAFVTNEEEGFDADALSCDATVMRDRFLKIRDRLEEGDLHMPERQDRERANPKNRSQENDMRPTDDLRQGPFSRHKEHRRHLRHKIMKRIMFIYDTDRDRTLNEEERHTILEDLDVRCLNITAKVLEHFDADEDGTLNDEERATAKEAWRAKKGDNRNAFREAADTNDDGELSEDERRAAFEARRTKHREKRQAIKAEFDADEDGVLNEEEKDVLRNFLRQKIRMEQAQEENVD